VAWYLTVTSGNDESQLLTITEGECMIGRAPTAGFVLRDESVAWEHARVRIEGEKLFLQNLSSLGTYVKGRRVTDEMPLNDGDAIKLSESCEITVKSEHSSSAGTATLTVVLLLIVVAIAAAGAAMLLVDDSAPRRPKPTRQEWTQAYQRIEQRLVDWTSAGRMPEEVVDVYRDAWRLERANNYDAAVLKWEALRSSLMTLGIPSRGSNPPTFAEESGATKSSLDLVMGRVSGDRAFDWNSDEVLADAFVWFVRVRTELAKREAKGSS